MSLYRHAGHLIGLLTATAVASVAAGFAASVHPLAEGGSVLPMVTHIYGKLLACSQDWRALAVLISSTLVTAHLVAASLAVVRTKRRYESLALTLAVLPENSPTHAVWEFLQDAGPKTRVRVLATTEPLAFCAGLLQPTIYVSTETIKQLTVDELKAVLWHEKKHADDRDPLKFSLLAVPRAVFGYLPAFGYLVTAFFRGREYAADDFALQMSGNERPLLGAMAKLGPAMTPAVHFASAHDGVSAARIHRLLRPGYVPPVVGPGRWVLATVSTLSILAAIPAVSLTLTEAAHLSFFAI